MTFAEQIAARTLWQEARGEPEEGQRAVAHVLVNRLRSGRWGTSLAGVCLARKQFSGWNDNDPNRLPSCLLADNDPALIKFGGFLADALTGEPDPTHGATHYYATSMATPPAWAIGQTPSAEIGNHRFFRGIK